MSRCIKCGDEKDPAIYEAECVCIMCIMEDPGMIRIAAKAVVGSVMSIKNKCYVCQNLAETRPYGEDNKNICHPCMVADPEREATARRILRERLRPSEPMVLTDSGPIRYADWIRAQRRNNRRN